DSAERAVKHLRALLGTPAVALADTSGLLAWDGLGGHHAPQVADLIASTVEVGDTGASDPTGLECDNPGCPVRHALATPLVVEDRTVGVLLAMAPEASAGLLLAVHEVGRWVSGQLDLAELDAERHRAMEAEVRALRAQISPHFIYNSLG